MTFRKWRLMLPRLQEPSLRQHSTRQVLLGFISVAGMGSICSHGFCDADNA